MARKSATRKSADAAANNQAAAKKRVGIMISVTPEFAEIVKNAAGTAGISTSVYIGRLLASATGTAVANVVPSRSQKRAKYATKELAKAAQKAAAKARNAKVAALLAALKSGEISDELLTKYAKAA